MSKKTFTPHTPSLFSILGTPGVREIEHKNRNSIRLPPDIFSVASLVCNTSPRG
jgi:hypothetical protein